MSAYTRMKKSLAGLDKHMRPVVFEIITQNMGFTDVPQITEKTDIDLLIKYLIKKDVGPDIVDIACKTVLKLSDSVLRVHGDENITSSAEEIVFEETTQEKTEEVDVDKENTENAAEAEIIDDPNAGLVWKKTAIVIGVISSVAYLTFKVLSKTPGH